MSLDPGSRFRSRTVVVGAGVIGLTCAWRLAQSGMDVTLCDPDPAKGAGWVAAGMLAPVTEVHYGEEALLELNLAAAQRWANFAAELQNAAGIEIGYRRTGTLLVAMDAGDRSWVRQLFEYQQNLGIDARWLTPRQAKELEPALAPGIAAAVFAPEDHQVSNRLLLAALVAANDRAGTVTIRERVTAIALDRGAVRSVSLESGESLAASCVVVAAGWRSGEIGGLPSCGSLALRPVKGQIIRLRPRSSSPSLGLAHVTRGVVQGSNVYLVPRSDGEVVVGATSEDLGSDQTVTAGAVYELLRDARRVVPGITEMELSEASAGLRPATPDNGPVVGAVEGVDGLIVATGHYRNGILQSPITADAVVALAAGGRLPRELHPFCPRTFSQQGIRGAMLSGSA